MFILSVTVQAKGIPKPSVPAKTTDSRQISRRIAIPKEGRKLIIAQVNNDKIK